MTEQDHVTVNDPHGPVNNGLGPQYVFYGVGADWMIRKGAESLRIIREDRMRLADRFVSPAGYRIAAWDGHGRGGAMFDREEEVGVSDRLLLLLAAVGLKPDMDEYTVFVHRVVRSLEAAGLDEAAEEIRRTLLPEPDEDGGEGPEDGPSGEGGATGPWPPRFPDPESSPFTDAGTFTPGAAKIDTGERNQGRQETSEDGMTPPSGSPHRPAAPRAREEPAAPRAREEDDEDGS
ncbi:hypothetical protein [Streptomyces albipurpureus]|uniref:Uncharacterized protein n=1 Tax=Streptomyces albipurpureus TaxID=2897419 RepID=A0ABT0UKZ0_9ACTN|nr:hypothetical protein [Streptomyces sp. CWNU-1]MCM2389130.1 hypothetical protein [Streptomyces sp. CWNU-1]